MKCIRVYLCVLFITSYPQLSYYNVITATRRIAAHWTAKVFIEPCVCDTVNIDFLIVFIISAR